MRRGGPGHHFWPITEGLCPLSSCEPSAESPGTAARPAISSRWHVNTGWTPRVFLREPAGLRDLPLPMIIFLNFNHFVVLEGIAKGKAYLNDPSCGPRTVTMKEFDQAFTGVALTFEPTPEFKKGGVKPSLVRALLNRLQGSRTALTYAVLAGLLLVIPGLIIPSFSMIFIDHILLGQSPQWLRPLLFGMALTALMRAGLTWLQNFYLLRMETRMALSSSAKFFYHVFRLPMVFFSQRFGGEVGSRVCINDRVAQLLSSYLASNALGLVMAVFFAVLMFQYDMILTLASISIALFNLGVLRFVSRKRIDLNQRMLQEQGKLLGTTMHGIQMIETLKSSGGESDFFSMWAGYQTKLVNAQQVLGLSSQMLTAIPPMLMAINNVAILTLGGLRVMDGRISIGMLVAFQTLMMSFLLPVNTMVGLGGKLQEGEGYMKRLDDVSNYPMDRGFLRQAPDPSLSGSSTKLTGHVEIKGLTFGYCRLDPPLIKDFDLVLKPGARVAIVGGSGSGKSTIVRLIAGLYEPWSGDIFFDGKPREFFPKRVLTNSIGVVDQDIFLFGGTVRENLAMWDETMPEARIRQAAKDSHIQGDIAARQGDYDSMLAEDGGNFSGGQRQRMEIARALVSDPSIVILDEATSALDPNAEKIIDKNLRRRGCTCLIVAHRLSTIRDCDEIIVLDAGKVVQRGTHDGMAKRGWILRKAHRFAMKRAVNGVKRRGIEGEKIL